MAPRTLLVTFLLTLAISAVALAGPLKGKTYRGTSASTGLNFEHHPSRPSAVSGITLAVSSNGRSVTVRFTSTHPVLYCRPEQALRVQTTKAVPISSSGKFQAKIYQRFNLGPGPASITQVVSGQFSGGTVKGTITTQAYECGGTTRFSAKAH